jgi:hypothetical protein
VDAFSRAVDALFRDPNIGRDGMWRAGGSGAPLPVRVVLRNPDEVVGFGGARLRVETCRIDLRVAEVAILADGDTIEVGGVIWTSQGAPSRDAGRLVWSAEAVAS